MGNSSNVVTNDIERKLHAEEQTQHEIKTMLLLGPGGSGKSTILKQLQWLHLDGFTKEATLALKRYIFTQTTAQMKNLLKYYDDQERKRSSDDVELENAIEIVQSYAKHFEAAMDSSLADAIKYIWENHEQIKNVFNDYDVFKYNILDESTEHFWNAIDRIKDPHYVPNEEDILNVRCKTTGAVQKEFSIKSTKFHVYDVGGQKSERRKWLCFFHDVQVILFVISLSCYNKYMFQDASKNAMVDSMELFDTIVNNRNFDSTHVILFLNKKDLFEKKIQKVPITVCPAFIDYDEYEHGPNGSDEPNPNDFVQTTSYIRRKLHALKKKKEKPIYTHVTYALERKNIDRVFVDVHRIVVTMNLSISGALV